MRRILVIGTLHENLTPENELFELLKKYQPTQILVEITQKDLQKEKITKYPPEMRAIYRWAKKHHLIIKGFDSPINILRPGITKAREAQSVKKFKELIAGLTWKDLNQKAYDEIGDEDLKELIDPEKDQKREQEMLSNIQNLIAPEGIIVIVTGAGHLNFFEKNLADAEFPLR